MRPACQPPVETREVDEHDRSWPMPAEVTVGDGDLLQEYRRVGQDLIEPHDGDVAKRIEQSPAGVFHALAAESDPFNIGLELTHGSDEVGTVKVAARFAG
jgi:hypothetical protein